MPVTGYKAGIWSIFIIAIVFIIMSVFFVTRSEDKPKLVVEEVSAVGKAADSEITLKRAANIDEDVQVGATIMARKQNPPMRPPELISYLLITFGALMLFLPLAAFAMGPNVTLLRIRALTTRLDRVYYLLGYVCGLELLMLGFFITYQVVARKLDWVQAPGTDVMSGYVLAMAATWAFSYSLRSGAHVRIDVLLPYMSSRVRAAADWMALASVLFLGWVTMWKMWENVVNNYERGVVTNDYPLTPLFIPKIVVSLGFTLLCLTAIQMMYSMVSEALLVAWSRARGIEDVEDISVTEEQAAAVA